MTTETTTDRDVLADVEERVDDLEQLLPGLRQRLASLPDPEDTVLSPRAARALEEQRRKLNFLTSEIGSSRNLLSKPGPRFQQLVADRDRLVAARTAVTAQRATADEATTPRIDAALRALEQGQGDLDMLPVLLGPLFLTTCGECGHRTNTWPGGLQRVEPELALVARRLGEVRAHVDSLTGIARQLLATESVTA